MRARSKASLDGVTVLVVEDEYYLADDLCRALRSAGADVAGPAATPSDARAAIEERPIDCAILDVNLRGETSAGIAERLRELGIPFVFSTGYSGGTLPDLPANSVVLQKPFDAAEAMATLAELLPQGG